ncbi:MAG: serine/threonine protein kinase [Armatimonadetes bacterium]|nr:serine/threonine protein kinase [Armatimonadota bacterium]
MELIFALSIFVILGGFAALYWLHSRKDQIQQRAREAITTARETLSLAGFPFSVDGYIGNYRITERLNDGGLSYLYKVEDRHSIPHVLKVLKPEHYQDTEFLHRFRRETEILKTLNHPQIVRFESSGEEMWNGIPIPYFVREYVRGISLAAHLEEQKKLPLETTLNYAASLCQALDYAHLLDIVHRNVKPQNVLIGPQGNVKLINFSVARDMSGDAVTQAGTPIGTLMYMAPEQIKGESVGPFTDVYAVGVLLYQLATGDYPFPKEKPYQLASMILQVVPADPSFRNADITPDVSKVIVRAMEKRPQDRYPNMPAFISDLNACLDRMHLEQKHQEKSS